MKITLQKSTTLYLYLLIAIFSGSFLQAGKADKLISKIQKKYRSVKTIKIEFRESVHFKLTDTMTEISGILHMEGKEKYRLDSEDQALVSDGKTVWRFNKLESQVLVDNAKKTDQDVMLNNFLYEIKDHYFGQIIEEQKDDKGKTYIIKLTPKPSEESFFTEIKMSVRDKTWEIEKLVYVDYNNNKTVYIIEKIEFNPDIPGATFAFTPPEGIQVIDLRF